MKRNIKKDIAQKGGLMIEALAMLGLIAVVTPTMYKKSAERTLEVEDINTADTVRSYMGAAEAYMAANYRNLIKEMTEDGEGNALPPADQETVREVEWSDIQPYMPYGFNNGKALYDYNSPKIAIVRQGTNLTAFALFPAKSAGGLGQERTSRIASLIGANGGYVKADKSAHGIGGVWNLSANDVKDVFGSNSNNEFSLVTASSNVINSTSGAGAVENTKYLQRTAENDGEKWRNAMRTDLYMGGGDGENDPDDREHVGNHNILNINSLIVGAEKDMAHLGDVESTANNGLYLNPDGTNPNAYIGGSLTALVEKYGNNYAGQFVVEKKGGTGYMYFGKPTITTTDNGDGTTTTSSEYPFRVEGTTGEISNWGDVSLAEKLESGRSVAIGTFNNSFKINNSNATNARLFYGETKNTDTEKYAKVSILGEEMFQLTTDNKEIDNEMARVGGTHVMIEKTGFKGADKVNSKDSRGNDILPRYTKDQTFPVVVGSNAMVKGVLSAGQVDTQNLRTASLVTGSANIDDEYKWLNVDRNGIIIRDINNQKTTTDENGKISTTGMYSEISANRYMTRTGNAANDAKILMQRTETTNEETGAKNYSGNVEIQGKDALFMTNDPNDGKVTVRNGRMGTQIQNRDMTIGVKSGDEIVMDNSNPSGNQYRVVVGKGGNVDMVGSNLQIMDNDRYNILTVRGRLRTGANGESLETQGNFGPEGKNNDFIFRNSAMGNIDYNIATHGNVLFSSMSSKNANQIYGSGAGAGSTDDTAHFMAIGPDDEKAGVNIAESTSLTASSKESANEKRVLFVDLSKDDENAYVNTEDNYSLKSDATSSSSNTENYNMNPGTVYVRKGLVEIVPDRDNVSIDSSTGRANNPNMGANDGSGIIRASRFVANNINKSGKEEKVPEILQSGLIDSYNSYNGSNTVRYDTYMVNPAYTSVMKDIKLTTRGGARLSDILPDFITKGIYLAGNTFDDTKQKMEFKLASDGSFKLADEPSETLATTTTSSGTYTSNNWASPYSGLVPAPQCPPGYGRVITITPYRFEMAQAGQLALAADSGDSNSAGYYVNTSEMINKLKRASYSHAKKEDLQNELMTKTPGLHQLNIEWNSGSMNASVGSGFTAGGDPVTGSGNISVSKASGLEASIDLPIFKTDTTSQQNEEDTTEESAVSKTSYVISAAADGMRPLVFQQSTWFHSEAVPVVPSSGNMGDTNGTYVGYDTAGKYVRGWAVLQGFLYHYNEYKNFACPSGEDCKELSTKAGTDENEVLWNLFPVAKNSIGSYISTYCYFDRTNMFGDYQNTEDTFKSIERMDILNEVPTDFKKGITGNATNDATRKTYYENLNDPTMKYNEVW